MIPVYKMECIHPTDEKSSIGMVPYSSEYQERYKKIYNECFHEMREALKIEPLDFIQDDSFFDTGMENVFLLLDDDEIIGSVAVKDDEIDDLIVSSLFQGKGYGRQILLWALEYLGTRRAILHVAAWNEKAVSLYKRTGFDITETIGI